MSAKRSPWRSLECFLLGATVGATMVMMLMNRNQVAHVSAATMTLWNMHNTTNNTSIITSSTIGLLPIGSSFPPLSTANNTTTGSTANNSSASATAPNGVASRPETETVENQGGSTFNESTNRDSGGFFDDIMDPFGALLNDTRTTLYNTKTANETHHDVDYPEPKNNSFYDKLVSLGLERSQKQFRKFLFREKNLTSMFDIKTRYYFTRSGYAAYLVSKEFAFLHIWKNGGTTVELMPHKSLKQQHIYAKEVERRKWFAVVRDPINHFLSGWAECGYRQFIGQEGYLNSLNLTDQKYEYDFRVREFLMEVKRIADRRPLPLGCYRHALPQANFMMGRNGRIDPHVKVVGDLSELKGMVVDIGGFEHWNDTTRARISSETPVKVEHFPSNRSLLSDGTLLELCKFLQLDYYLFDFDPPPICIADGGPLDFQF